MRLGLSAAATLDEPMRARAARVLHRGADLRRGRAGDGRAHVHAEFYPPYRMRDRLKYLAGSEIGAGVFTADTLPEERAAELQRVPVTLR